MRIVIDLQACQSGSRFRGIGRYSMELAKAVARRAGNHDLWLVLNDRLPDTIPAIRHEFDGLVPRDQIAVFAVNGPVAASNPDNLWRARAAERIREYFLAGLKPDVVHVSSLFEGWSDDTVGSIGVFDHSLLTTVTLYDLIPFVRQSTYLPNRQIRDHYLAKIQSLRNARCLLAISEFSKRAAIESLAIRDESIVNISSAVDARFRRRDISPSETHTLLSRYSIVRPFVMYAPGGFDERKNLPGLLKAYSLLDPELRRAHQLLVAGKRDESACTHIAELAREVGLGDDELVLTDYVADDDLIALYNLCKVFVFPSLYEGFGLPVLEAMACGAAVVASNTTSIPEVVGRTDALFDPSRPEAITEMMRHVLTDEGFRQSLREHGLQQAERFSWDNSAAKAIEAFEEVHKRSLIAGNVKVFDSGISYGGLLTSIAEIKTTVMPTTGDLLRTGGSIAIDTPLPGSRQLLVDISELTLRDAKSGIQRAVRSILLELLKSPPPGYRIEPVYYDDCCYRYGHRFTNDVLGFAVPSLEDDVVDLTRGDVYLGLDLSLQLASTMYDYLKHMNIVGVNVHFVVYDVLPALHPEWWEPGLSGAFIQWLKSIAEVSTGLICISRSVATDLTDWLGTHPPDRAEPLPIESFHLGADFESSLPTTGLPDDARDVLTALASVPTFVMVGSVVPRRGHRQTLSAFEALWREGLGANLVIVGKRGWSTEVAEYLDKHPMLGKRLFWLEDISDEYLEKIYAASTCLIAASEAEGFGLPLVEAARKGLPIIARDIPVFREVAGDRAFYFSGMSREDLAQAVMVWLDLSSRGKAPSSKDMPWLTWKESTAQLLKAVLPS